MTPNAKPNVGFHTACFAGMTPRSAAKHPSLFDGRAVADNTTPRRPRPTGRTRFRAAPLKDQHCLDETRALVLSLFYPSSWRTLLVRSFRTRRKLGRRRFERD